MAGGLNLYGYVGGNPVNRIDPNGLWFGADDIFTGPVDEIIVLGGLWIAASIGSEGAQQLLDSIKNSFNDDDAELLIRRGKRWESTNRLAKQCEAAEKAGVAKNGTSYGYGVSVTTSMLSNNNLAARFGRDPADFSSGLRTVFEASGFDVRDTPTSNDPYHKTVVFPKPVTPEMAATFNKLLGRFK